MIRILVVLLCLSGLSLAQESKATAPSPKYYKLDFTVKELESGKVINLRSYSLSIVTPADQDRNGEIRAGEKIPFIAGPQGPSQINVGVNIDCRQAKEIGERLSLKVSAEISSVAAYAEKGALPVVRQTQMDTFVLIPLKKPTQIFSSDEPFSKGQLQIELTATPLN